MEANALFLPFKAACLLHPSKQASDSNFIMRGSDLITLGLSWSELVWRPPLGYGQVIGAQETKGLIKASSPIQKRHTPTSQLFCHSSETVTRVIWICLSTLQHLSLAGKGVVLLSFHKAHLFFLRFLSEELAVMLICSLWAFRLSQAVGGCCLAWGILEFILFLIILSLSLHAPLPFFLHSDIDHN